MNDNGVTITDTDMGWNHIKSELERLSGGVSISVGFHDQVLMPETGRPLVTEAVKNEFGLFKSGKTGFAPLRRTFDQTEEDAERDLGEKVIDSILGGGSADSPIRNFADAKKDSLRKEIEKPLENAARSGNPELRKRIEKTIHRFRDAVEVKVEGL